MTKKTNTGSKTCTFRHMGQRIASAVLCFALIMAGLLFFGAQSASAMSCYIDAQPESAEVGQPVTVTVVFSGDNVGRVRATLEYDTSVLSYQGEEGDSGTVSLYLASNGGDISYNLPFKAVGAGSSTLVMTPLDAYDMDELPASLPEAQSMTVTIKEAPAAQPQPAQPEQTDSEKSDSEKTDTKTDDQQTVDPAKPDNKDQTDDGQKKDEKDGTESHIPVTIWILAGLAVLIAVILIAIRVRKAHRE